MIFLREIDPTNMQEIELVARRMQQTLIDVLGEEQGTSLYSLDWLKKRVLWHLSLRDKAKIYLAENNDKTIVAQAIVRAEDSPKHGYFSTIYVLPNYRNLGIATLLIKKIESWCSSHNLPYILYNTAENNRRLIDLLKKFNYQIILESGDMVQLKKNICLTQVNLK